MEAIEQSSSALLLLSCNYTLFSDLGGAKNVLLSTSFNDTSTVPLYSIAFAVNKSGATHTFLYH